MYLTAEELAKALKVKLSAVRKWTFRGMPCAHAGRLPRYELEKVLAWHEGKKTEKESREQIHI